MEENKVVMCEKCFRINEPENDRCKYCGAKLNNNSAVENGQRYVRPSYGSRRNTISMALMIIGILDIICGFILGNVLGNVYKIGTYYDEFNMGLCIGCIVAGFISGVVILGFGEVIQKLQNIEDNTRK